MRGMSRHFLKKNRVCVCVCMRGGVFHARNLLLDFGVGIRVTPTTFLLTLT